MISCEKFDVEMRMTLLQLMLSEMQFNLSVYEKYDPKGICMDALTIFYKIVKLNMGYYKEMIYFPDILDIEAPMLILNGFRWSWEGKRKGGC